MADPQRLEEIGKQVEREGLLSLTTIDAGYLYTLVRTQAAEIARLTRATRVRDDYPFHCSRCGAAHNLDTSVPSVVWNKAIRPILFEQDLGEMLCVLCIDEMVAAAGLTCDVEFYFTGDAIKGRLYDDDQGTNEMLRREIERLEKKQAGLLKALKEDGLRKKQLTELQSAHERIVRRADELMGENLRLKLHLGDIEWVGGQPRDPVRGRGMRSTEATPQDTVEQDGPLALPEEEP